MSMPILYRGENRLITRQLRQDDGTTPLLVSALSSVVLKLYQGDTLQGTFTKGTDPQLRAGTGTDELVFELTSTISLALAANLPLTLRWELQLPDADFSAEPSVFIDHQIERPFLIK